MYRCYSAKLIVRRSALSKKKLSLSYGLLAWFVFCFLIKNQRLFNVFINCKNVCQVPHISQRQSLLMLNNTIFIRLLTNRNKLFTICFVFSNDEQFLRPCLYFSQRSIAEQKQREKFHRTFATRTSYKYLTKTPLSHTDHFFILSSLTFLLIPGLPFDYVEDEIDN